MEFLTLSDTAAPAAIAAKPAPLSNDDGNGRSLAKNNTTTWPVALILWLGTFLVFAAHGAWPTPDSNETHYLGKAKHHWDPVWGAGDFFLESVDAHQIFYWAFGWTTQFLPLTVVAWLGRIIIWAGLAAMWQRLTRSVLGKPDWGPLAAALFVLLSERLHMAGEWVIGGVEAKGFAFIFVWYALAEITAGRWRWSFAWLGLASAFHVLVGGWATFAVLVTWCISGRKQAGITVIGPSLLLGGILALPSLWWGYALTRGVDPATVAQANQIYVVERLPHHLYPPSIPVEMIWRHLGLIAGTALLTLAALALPLRGAPYLEQQMRRPTRDIVSAKRALNPADDGLKTLAIFTAVCVFIFACGFLWCYLFAEQPERLFALLRLYWFRSSDAFVPLLGAFAVWRFIDKLAAWRTGWAWLPMIAVSGAVVWDLAAQVAHWPFDVPGIHAARTIPRPEDKENFSSADWQDLCDWIAKNTPPDARYLTPRVGVTFKWHTGRAEVVTSKDLPQDAASIVRWWAMLNALHAHPVEEQQETRWKKSFAAWGYEGMKQLSRWYGAEYIVVHKRSTVPRLSEKPLYENESFALYHFPK